VPPKKAITTLQQSCTTHWHVQIDWIRHSQPKVKVLWIAVPILKLKPQKGRRKHTQPNKL